MALQGNLKDFSIGNIFQMIFLENKGGILSVAVGNDSAKVFFDKGKILAGELGKVADERRLGKALVNNGYISKQQWNDIQSERNRTMESVWSILARYVEPDMRSLFIQRQVQHVLLGLLQWKSGEYTFDPDATVTLDKNIFSPIDGEFLVMEAYRVIDEWSEVKKNLPPEKALVATSTEIDETLSASGYTPTETENVIIKLATQGSSVENLLDSSMGDICETGRAILNLLSLGLLNVVKKEALKKTIRKKDRTTGKEWRRYAVLGVLMGCMVFGLWVNYKGVDMRIQKIRSELFQIEKTQTVNSIARLKLSLQYYYALNGTVPVSLQEMVDRGYLSSTFLKDSWGNFFVYKKQKKHFLLYSTGTQLEEAGDDIY